MKNQIYKYITKVYKCIMKDINYAQWAEYIYELSSEYVEKDAKVLELAAGNGNLINHLQKYFDKKIIATDLSLNMLRENEKKSNTLMVCCNMNELPFNDKFDLIYSAFDSVNYLLEEEKIIKLFNSVKEILNPEGVFTFDAALEKNSIKYVKSMNREGHCDGIHYKQTSEYDKKTRLHRNYFEIKNSDGEIFTEEHIEKIYPIEYWLNIASKCGFYIMEALEAFSFDDVSKRSERLQLVLKIDKE